MTTKLNDQMELRTREALAGVFANPPAVRDESPISPRKLLAALFRQRVLLFSLTALGFLVGAFLAIVTPNSWVSRGQFMFTGAGSEGISVDPGRGGEIRAETISQNATYVFTANDLFVRVVDTLGPKVVLKPYLPTMEGGSWISDLFHNLQRQFSALSADTESKEDALKLLKNSIVVEKPRNSDVLLVSAAANSPELAQQILRVYMQEAVQWHMEKYDDDRTYAEVTKRAEAAETRLDKLRKEEKSFLEQNDLHDFPHELSLAREQESVQAGEVDNLHGQIESTKKQVAQLEERLKTLSPTRVVLSRPDVSPVLAFFQTQINELDSKRLRALALAPAGTTPREVEDYERQIKSLQESQERERKRALEAPPVETRTDNPEWQDTNNSLVALKLNEQRLLIEVEGATKRYEKTKQRLIRLTSFEDRYADLTLRLSQAEEERKQAADARDKANLKKSLKLGNVSSLQQIESASLPLEKEGPNRAKLILGGLFVGLFLGLGIILTRLIPDSTIRLREDMERLEDVVVIGVMPRLDGRNIRRHRAFREQGW